MDLFLSFFNYFYYMAEQRNKHTVSASRGRKRHVSTGLNLVVFGVIHITKVGRARRGRRKGAGYRGKLLGIHRTSVSRALYEPVQKGYLNRAPRTVIASSTLRVAGFHGVVHNPLLITKHNFPLHPYTLLTSNVY